MKFKHHLEFDTTEEVNTAFKDGNKKLSNLIVDTAVKHTKTKRKNIPVVSITTNDDDLIYDIIIERNDLLLTLQENLKTMEDYEDYERCQNIVEAINYLKSKK